jgi:hypothetical protein
MELHLEETEQLVGFYMYHKYRQRIPLYGTFTYRTGHVVLDEYGQEDQVPGVPTGHFEGNFVTPNRLEGIWRNPSGTRTYPFRIEREQRELVTGYCSDGKPFSVAAVPLLNELRWSEDQILLHIQGKDAIPLTAQWLAETCNDVVNIDDLGGMNTQSIAVHVLPGSPELLHIAWDTYPVARTRGQHCLLIVQNNDVSVRLFDRCLGTSFTQSDWDGWLYASVIYNESVLHITKYHSYQTFYSQDERLELGEQEITCSYKVRDGHLTLFKTHERSRSVEGIDEQDGWVSNLLGQTAWEEIHSEALNENCPSFR